MQLGTMTMDVSRTGETAKLYVSLPPYRLVSDVAPDDLERAARWLESEALEMRRVRNRAALPTHYDILGVPRTASSEDIQSAFRTAAKRQHPDTSGGETGAAMTQINEAYDTLSDDNTRRMYDATFTTMKGE